MEEALERYRQQHIDARAFLESECVSSRERLAIPEEHVTPGLTRDRIRHAARTPGGEKGDYWDDQRPPAQSEFTRSKDSSRIVTVRLAEDAARDAVKDVRTTAYDVTQ